MDAILTTMEKRGLRSILRHDPEVLLIGKIREIFTAGEPSCLRLRC